MADVTDPEAIRFCNEVVRPIAERLRDLDAVVADAMGEWFGGINTVIGSSGDDDIADGREGEGVSRLTAADVAGLFGQAGTIATQFGGAGVMDVIRKPCVRRLRIQES